MVFVAFNVVIVNTIVFDYRFNIQSPTVDLEQRLQGLSKLIRSVQDLSRT